MSRRLISSGSPFEAIAGYSRAVVEDDWVLVSGTTGLAEDGTYPPDVADQTERAIEIIALALAEAGSSLADVVRLRCYIANRDDFMTVAKIVGRHFGDIRPANTTVCAILALPEMKVEIEVSAHKSSELR
ncbi:MAG: RidA family protein [Alphaproteobacteria bacterium]